MQKLPLSLDCVRAARGMRAGLSHEAARKEFGISLPRIVRIESAYSNVPDNVLAGLERILTDRERLKRLISDLIHAHNPAL
jgi:hypothetical protein